MHYERLKHDGTLPLVGVNTFLAAGGAAEVDAEPQLMRSTEAEKRAQIDGVHAFSSRMSDRAPEALWRLREVARSRGNVFEALMETAKVASLGEISGALYAVGGEYRRNM